MSQLCQSVRGSLEAFADGDLDDLGAGQVREHLASCSECRAQHDLAAAIPSRLRALGAPAPPPGLLPGVMLAVRSRGVSPLAAWAFLAAEAALAGLVVAYLSGVGGLIRLAGATAGDVSQLLQWGTGASAPPVPAVTDLFLTTAAIALVAVTGLHIVLLGRPGSGRPAA